VGQIRHIFVLMLENRAFDHMLGFSSIVGANAETGKPTAISGLTGDESNTWAEVVYSVSHPAVDPMTIDPCHEFLCVLEQLCGHDAVYPHGGGQYPVISNSGFASNFATAVNSPSPGDVMKCFTSEQLPVLSALAKEFCVCDAWYCSMPGPTWPNRFFALGGSSAGLDHSPTTEEMGEWESVNGFKFQHGSIFERRKGLKHLEEKLKWRIYGGNVVFTFAHALKEIHLWDVRRYTDFAKDVGAEKYDAEFTWIEPNYGHVLTNYEKGDSQHPLDGVAGGEALIKATYEAVRNSPLWESSMLIITWDEHGGFYDHVAPPSTMPPADNIEFGSANKYGFRFDQLGPRVPAVVISPLIPQNVIDHRTYDHTSILATTEKCFDLQPMTERDRNANDLLKLATLETAREVELKSVPVSEDQQARFAKIPLDGLDLEFPPAARPDDPIDDGLSGPGYLYLASRADVDLPPASIKPEDYRRSVQKRIKGMKTRGEARDYIEEVRKKVSAAKQNER
jgi:phospholipase C